MYFLFCSGSFMVMTLALTVILFLSLSHDSDASSLLAHTHIKHTEAHPCHLLMHTSNPFWNEMNHTWGISWYTQVEKDATVPSPLATWNSKLNTWARQWQCHPPPSLLNLLYLPVCAAILSIGTWPPHDGRLVAHLSTITLAMAAQKEEPGVLLLTLGSF